MFKCDRLGWLFLLSGCCWSVLASLATAQVTPDNTLNNENSTVTPNVTVKDAQADLIEGGAIRDNNLFHSFSEFNVGEGNAVYFANPDGVANILTRVTGNNISNIFGILGVDGAANLFLLNPNGVVFGENAALDVNGSFLATTADSYIFENDFAYSASNPEVPPLLTIDLPLGLQFGTKAESIVNRSQALGEFYFPSGLEVLPENNITLVGGDILFESGNLTASSGQVEIGAVAPESKVTLNPFKDNWTIGYEEVTAWQNIQMTQFSSIDTSGNGAGGVKLRGKQIQILDETGIYAINFGDRDSETIFIFGSELVELTGGQSFSSIQSIADDVGRGGDVEIKTNVLRLINGGQIGTGTDSSGASGNLSVQANQIVVSGLSIDEFPSGLFTTVGAFAPEPSIASGRGGDVNLTTENLEVSEGGIIAAGTFGAGSGGNITIAAKDILIDSAILDSSTFELGNSGNIKIDTQNLTLSGEQGGIGSVNFGSGQAGNITIRATEAINISGVGVFLDPESPDGVDLFSSGLFTSVQFNAAGDGGNINLETDKLRVFDGGKIVASTAGIGDAGNILIRANAIAVEDAVTSPFGDRSGINSSVEATGFGNGGDLKIYTDSLNINDGGLIAVDAKGQGNAGDIYLQATEVGLTGTSSIEPIFGVEQQSLPSQISAFASGEFNAGSILINTDRLQVGDSAEISVSNVGTGNSGNLNINAQEIALDNGGKLNAEVNGGGQGNINLNTENLLLRDGGSISARAMGTSAGGNISISSTDHLVVLNDSSVVANATQGNGGDIKITTQGYFVSNNSLVSASSEFGLDGNIEVDTINGDRKFELDKLPENTVQANQQIAASCEVGANQFAISGRGGLPANPTQNLRGQAVWQDSRLVNIDQNRAVKSDRQVRHKKQKSVVEAQAWKINDFGKVELVAVNSDNIVLNKSMNCH